MDNLEKEFCKKYDLIPRKISDKKVLQIFELLIRHFRYISFHEHQWDNCAYDLSSEIPSKLQRDDEEKPFCGFGWNIKDVILTQCLDNEAVDNDWFRDDVRYLLLTPAEKLKEMIWN